MEGVGGGISDSGEEIEEGGGAIGGGHGIDGVGGGGWGGEEVWKGCPGCELGWCGRGSAARPMRREWWVGEAVR
jgi:hypothetical protein